MKIARIILAAIALLPLVGLQAQKCGTDALTEHMKIVDPNMIQRMDDFNATVLANPNPVMSRAALYTIPVVFHVIHTNGSENISREQILDQMRILNKDFSSTNWNKGNIRAPFKSLATDVQVQFQLASIDPNGNCTDGINRVFSPLGVNVSQSTEEFKALSYWNSSKYLNIWVVTSIESSSGIGTTLGYAYLPWMNPASKNGVTLRSDRVGSIGTGQDSDSGRTLTHEIGHWLGLYHTFQDGCQTGSNAGDYCADTPPVKETFTNAQCPANGNSCNNDNPDLLDMWENYMDYSEGTCMAMFTPNQKTRMLNSISQYKSNLVSASNLIATGITPGSVAPVANFTSNQRLVCTGTPVTFYDISCKGTVTGRSWTFQGANISSSSAQNPVVIYQTAGKYKVTLLVQNSKGNNTKSVDEYIEVIGLNSANTPNVEEDFENDDPAGKGIVSVSTIPWQWINSTGHSGTHCLKAPVGSTDPSGTVYSFITPAYDLTVQNGISPKITFFAAYALPTGTNFETLKVSISTDCGYSFQQIYERSASSLAYNGAPKTSNFVPSQSYHWKLLGVTSLNSLGYNNTKHAIFKIDVLSAQGNPVYIDDINIGPWFAGTSSPNPNIGAVQIFPNPAAESATLEMEVKETGNYVVEIYDVAGRKVANVFSGLLNTGPQKLSIVNPGAAKGSLFFVKIISKGGQVTKPITFAN